LLLQQKHAVTEEQRMTSASELAQTAQPQGHTLADVKVKTKIPHLMRGPGPLREYQHIGLDWMVSMYDNGLNGILAGQNHATLTHTLALSFTPRPVSSSSRVFS
jgi:SNF2 family DNA or RNA helicase